MLAGNDKDLRAKALEAANKPPVVSPPPPTSSAPTMAPSSGLFALSPVAAPAPVVAQVVTGFGGKPAPAPAPQPEI
jgi:hypothetical protein